MRSRQRIVVVGALGAALLLALHPPWRATAVGTTTRYGAAAGTEPVALVDTVRWTLSFAPLYARPRAPVKALREIGAQPRAMGARNDSLRAVIQRFEERYEVPAIVRASGSRWRDSVLAQAGIPSHSAYEAAFSLDGAGLAIRLGLLALAASIAHNVLGRRSTDQLDENEGT